MEKTGQSSVEGKNRVETNIQTSRRTDGQTDEHDGLDRSHNPYRLYTGRTNTGTTIIQKVKSARDLGVYVDSELTMQTCVTKK